MHKSVLSKNLFLFKLIGVVVLSIAAVTATTLVIVLNEMNSRYINTLSRTMMMNVEKISREMSFSGETVIDMVRTLRSNWALTAYISDTDKTSANASYNTYSLVNTANYLLGKDIMGQMSIVIVGTNGETYITDGSSLAMPVDELLNSGLTQKAIANPTGIQYQFLTNGLTRATARRRVFAASAAVAPAPAEQPIAFIYITISRNALREYYSDMSNSENFVLLLDESGICVSSDNDDYIGYEAGSVLIAAKAAEGMPFFTVDINGRRMTGVSRPVDYWGLTMVAAVDTGSSPEMESAARYVLLAGIGVSIITIVLTTITFSRITRPLKTLTKRMSGLKSGDLPESLPVSGEYEIQELTSAYNYMLDSINRHLTQMKQLEAQKREYEIQALQTQIQPHFIYNTLSSVKWLIWRSDSEKASAALDLFIKLLKNIVSDKAEITPLRAEIENLENYVMLQQIRYGDRIQVAINVSDECLDASIPKMILQPIIENAFFHAYVDGGNGTINVFMSKSGQPGHALGTDSTSSTDSASCIGGASSTDSARSAGSASSTDSARSTGSASSTDSARSTGSASSTDSTRSTGSARSAGGSGQLLVIDIIDDGVGFPGVKLERETCPEAAEKCGFKGLGLINVDNRLKLLFGSGSNVLMTGEEGVGTVIRVAMPFTRAQKRTSF